MENFDLEKYIEEQETTFWKVIAFINFWFVLLNPMKKKKGKGKYIVHYVEVVIFMQLTFMILPFNYESWGMGTNAILIVIQIIMQLVFLFSSRSIYQNIESEKEIDRVNQEIEYDVQKQKPSGIFFGKRNGKFVMKPDTKDGNVLVVGGVGTGKTQGVILPTLELWQGSVLAIDIKGELSDYTYSSRKELNNNVIKFDVDTGHHAYNPIDFCTSMTKISNFSRSLIPIGAGIKEPYFKQTAQSVLSAFVKDAHMNGKTLGNIAEFICLNPQDEIVEFLENHDNKTVRMLGSSIFGVSENTLGSVMSELQNALINFATDDKIQNATRESTWSYEDLENNSTIYLVIPEYQLEQYRPLWNIIISQIMEELSKRKENNNKPILLAIDELFRLGKLPNYVNALSTLRSKNVHILSVIQSLSQLDERYGTNKRKIISDNSTYKFVLGASDVDTQKYFSELAGKQKVKSESTTTHKYDRMIGGEKEKNQKSVTISERKEYLYEPDEWNRLGAKGILFSPNSYPQEIPKTFWYSEFQKKSS